MKDIKAVFDHHFRHLKIDREFVKRLLGYVHQYSTKNEEHINFLGSNLLGVYKLQYTRTDSQNWIEDILEVEDWEQLEEDFHDLPTVHKEFNVAGSVLNMTFVYLSHRIMASALLPKDKERAAVAVISMLHYKFLGSLFSNIFRLGRAQESVALALYESLSRKSLLKRHQTWGRLVEARSEDVIGSDSIHNKTLTTGRDDKAMLYIVTDLQSRIRELILNLVGKYKELRDEDSRVLAEGRFLSVDGERVLRDADTDIAMLRREIPEVVRDYNDFLREELLNATNQLAPTSSERHTRQVLEYISEHSDDTRGVKVAEMVEQLIQYIDDHRRTTSRDEGTAAAMIVKLRNMFRSSQLTNPQVVVIRDTMTEIVDKVLKGKPPALKAATRIAALVYLSLRILTFNHYRN